MTSKKGKKTRYNERGDLVEIKAGGIENAEINDSIVTILEGTMHSFRKRDEKYIEG